MFLDLLFRFAWTVYAELWEELHTMFVECYRVAEESDSRVLTGERQVLRNEAYGGDGVPVFMKID